MNNVERYIQLRTTPQYQQQGMWSRFIGGLRQATLGKLVQAEVRELTGQIVADIYYSRQHRDLDITEKRTRSATGRWQKIEELRRKYKGEAEYGNQLMGTITDFNATMQWGHGVRVVTKDDEVRKRGDKSPEQEVFEEFLDYNNLDREGGIDMGVTGELDGQALWFWDVDERVRQVRVWTVPLLESRYRVEYESRPWEPSRAVLYPGTKDEESRDGADFVFIKMRTVQNGSYGIPTCMRCIKEIEDLDKAKADLRQINHLFASPTPVFTGKDEDAMRRIADDIAAINWKIGKAFTLTQGDQFQLVTIPSTTPDPLKTEIVINVQFVSATTSVPVHFLGFPDLMSNTAVAREDFTPALVAAIKSQSRWMGGLEELAYKVLPIYGRLHGRTYDPEAVDVIFPPPHKGVIKELVTAWLPVRLAKQITHRTFLLKIGIDDPEDEIGRLVEEMAQGGIDEEEAEVQQDRLNRVIQLAQENARDVA